MRKKTKRKLKITGIILGVLAAAFFLFLGFFYVSDIHVEVVGSTRYTDQEIRDMVFQNFADRNSLYLCFYKKSLDPGQAFINSIDIEYESHNSVRLHVNEDAPVGYIKQDAFDYYFDAEGLVLEALPAGTDGSTASSDSTETVGTSAVSSSGAEDSGALQAVAERGSDTQYRPATADVVEVTGLTEDPLKVGETISVGEPTIFSTIQAVTRLFNKFDIKPDSISVDKEYNITLHYGSVDVCLGQDTLLEEKMSRVDAILPKLDGLSGTLHLENFSDDTVNIIFDKTDAESGSADESTESADSTGTQGTGSTGTNGTDSAGTDESGAADGTNTYGTDTYGTDTYGTDGTGTYGTDTYGTDGSDTYGTDTYGTDGTGTYGTDTNGSDGSNTYGTDTYGTDTYGTDPYGGDGTYYGY